MAGSDEALFHALADPTRRRCLVLLAEAGELCVCELTHALGAVQPKVSRHLAVLRKAGVVAGRRDGTWIYYRLHPELPVWAVAVVAAAAHGLRDLSPHREDRAALEAMADRPSLRCSA